MTANITRRRALKIGGGVCALGAGRLAFSAQTSNALPAGDAELVAIGERLDVVLAELSSRIEVQQFRLETAHEAAEADPAWPTASPSQRFEMRGRHEDLHGVNDDDADTDAPGFELTALRQRSEAIAATTWAGLRTKARFVAHAHGPLDEDSSDLLSLLRDLGALPAN